MFKVFLVFALIAAVGYFFRSKTTASELANDVAKPEPKADR